MYMYIYIDNIMAAREAAALPQAEARPGAQVGEGHLRDKMAILGLYNMIQYVIIVYNA